MKSKRQEAILTLIEQQDIETQEELAEALCREGYRVTQATVSRDIRELHLTKAPGNPAAIGIAGPPGGNRRSATG